MLCGDADVLRASIGSFLRTLRPKAFGRIPPALRQSAVLNARDID